MAATLNGGFKVTARETIDTRIVLTKAQMKNEQYEPGTVSSLIAIPANYFCLCKDDNKIYVFNSENSVDPTTGRYRELSTGSTITTYVKSAVVSEDGKTLTLVDQDDTVSVFQSGEPTAYVKSVAVDAANSKVTFTKKDDTTVVYQTKTINGETIAGTGNITTSTKPEYIDLSALSAVSLSEKTAEGVYKINHATDNPENTDVGGLLVVNELKEGKTEQHWYSNTNDAHRVIVGNTPTPIPTDGFYVNGEKVTPVEGVVSLNSGSVYHLNGTLNGVVAVIGAGTTEAPIKNFTRLYLDGVNIETSAESAIISMGAEARLEIEITENSKNYLKSTFVSTESSSDGLIHAESDINLSGTGYLSLIASKSHGIKCSDLIISGKPELYIDAFHDGLHAKTISIGDGKYYIKEANDAFSAGSKKNRGIIRISGGEITVEHCKENVFQSKKASEGEATNKIAEIYIYYDTKITLKDGFDSGRAGAFPVLDADTNGVIEIYPSVTITKPTATVITGLVTIAEKYGTPTIWAKESSVPITADSDNVFRIKDGVPGAGDANYDISGNFTGYRIEIENSKKTFILHNVYLNDQSDDTNPFIYYKFASTTASSKSIKLKFGATTSTLPVYGSAPTYLIKKNGSIIKSEAGHIELNSTDAMEGAVTSSSFDVYMSCTNGYCLDCAQEARIFNDGFRYFVNSKYGIKSNLVDFGDEFAKADYTKSKTTTSYCSNNNVYDIGVFHTTYIGDTGSEERDGRINITANTYCATFLGKLVKLVASENAYVYVDKHSVTPSSTSAFTRYPIVYAYENDLQEVLAQGELSRIVTIAERTESLWTVYKHITQTELDSRYVLKSVYDIKIADFEARITALEQGGGSALNPELDANGNLKLSHTSITDAGVVNLNNSTIDDTGNVTLR